MIRTYREVLARPGALAFSAAGALARLPISMVGIGIVLMVSDLYGSYALAGRVSAVYVVTHALCSPQLSRLVDQHGQARVMRPAVAVAAVGITSLVALGAARADALLLYGAAVVTGASVGSIGALVRSRWSHLLDDPRQLHTAYSFESAVDELVFVVGPVLATSLATGVHPTSGLVVPVVALVLGGLWFLGQRATEPPPVPRRSGERQRLAIRSTAMVALLVVFVGMGSIFGSSDVATVAFAEEQGRKGAAGVVLAVFAFGSLVAGLAYGARHWVSPLWQRFVVGILALAVGVSFFLVVRDLVALGAVMFVTGLSIAPTLVNGNNLVHQLVPPAQLTEGLTWVGTALGFGVSIGSSAAGSAIDAHGAHGGFVVVVASAGAAVLAALGSIGVLRRSTDAGRQNASPEGTTTSA